MGKKKNISKKEAMPAKKTGKRKYHVRSLWAGRYAHTYHGITSSPVTAVKWKIVWSAKEFIRVLRLNKYHYGNIFCLGKKKTDRLGRLL